MTQIIIMISLVILMVITTILRKKEKFNDTLHTIILISGILYLFISILAFIGRCDDRNFKRKYEVTKMTIESFRKDKSIVTDAIIYKDILEINKRIRSLRYQNSISYFDYYVVDEVADLPYLK